MDFIALEERLERLEKNTLSTSNARTGTVVSTLLNLSQKLKDYESSDKNLRKIYEQQMCNADTMDRSTSQKIDFIEASEKQLRKQASDLEAVGKLKSVLDSEHLKSRVTPDLNSRLLKLSQVHEDNQNDADISLSQTRQLIDNYNQAISVLSTQFECWNAVVAAMEESSEVVKD